ncbi:MAG TPA: glycosyltransferase [Solirubrobacteraceae bacterium]|nr:glycosyltransferase [Solirubrobacteraceae bacterium]
MAEPVDIILLTYNRPALLGAMVDSLERNTLWPHRLTIVDNASGPETRSWLRANAGRFERIVWNPSNEHLAGFQRGIAATAGELLVLSDADLAVHEPQDGACWLTRLVGLLERHPDFGLIGVRLDSVTEARNARLETAPLIDGEILEAASGVWLNLLRRSALAVPYMSDGITAHAIRRAGLRVGVAANVYATHLGDGDPQRHPDYLARKQAAGGWRTTYPDYPELALAAPPPTLEAIALAAPVLAALDAAGVAPAETVELASEPLLGAVEPEIATVAAPAGMVRALAVLEPGRPLDPVFAGAAETVVVLASAGVPAAPEGWQLVAETPGPHRAVLALAGVASGRRWRRMLLYSASEHRDNWLAVFRAGCFGEDPARRVYTYRRDVPLEADRPPAAVAARSASEAPRLAVRRRRIGSLATKLRRLLRAEWALLRGRGR